ASSRRRSASMFVSFIRPLSGNGRQTSKRGTASTYDASATQIVRLYGRRFTIEETFRDTKDIHFGMGLSATHIKSPARRERLLFLGAVVHALLTLLGESGERAGLARKLQANTTNKRSLSLYRQGCYWYDAIPAMDD